MNREEAVSALQLLRTIVNQARDDTALQNWGIIWMVHAVSNSGGFLATNFLLRRNDTLPWHFALMWGCLVTFNILTIFWLKTGSAGTRSFVEQQIWAIWLTFIGAVILVAGVNHLMGQPIFALAPIIAVLSAVGFSSMGALIERRFYWVALLFVAVTFGMVVFRPWQFAILGCAWGSAQLYVGYTLDQQRRRTRDHPAGARLV